MTRSLTLLSVLWLAPLVALAGCAPEVRVDDAALRAARPTSLAVLPFEVAVATPSPRAAAQVEAVRVAVHGRLAGKAWLHLELDEVDRRLARAGLDRARAATASTQLLARVLDVDAVVRGRITGLTHLQGGVVFRQAIEGELRLVDARQGVELARVQHTESSAGGLLLDYSQSLEAVQATIDDSSDLGFVRLAERFAEAVAGEIAALTGKPFVTAPDKFSALSAHDAVVNASAAVRTLAGAAMKIANDVRWHASGPRAGLAEITIPDNEPGSSIMPGKVNPTQCEALTMVAARVFGNDATVAFAGTQGNFQLNVYKPVMLHAALESVELLADALGSFDLRCARGIEPDRERIRANLERSLMLVTALNPHVGYENAARIAQKAHREGTGLREAALALGLVSAADFDRWVDPAAMTRPDGPPG